MIISKQIWTNFGKGEDLSFVQFVGKAVNPVLTNQLTLLFRVYRSYSLDLTALHSPTFLLNVTLIYSATIEITYI